MKQQPWLISYQYTSVHARGDDGGTSRIVGQTAINIVSEPPWKFLAQAALYANEMRKAPYPKNGTRLGDEITAVYWAVQLPIGALTEEEMDSLS